MSRGGVVRDDRRKWDALMRALPELNGAEVKVGIQSDAGTPPDGDTPIVEYAFHNEFGTDGGGWGGSIPERPFLRDTADQKRAEWNRIADRALTAAMTGKATVRRGLQILGEVAERDIKAAITGGGWAPNSPLTVELKGSGTPLIDTGAMRQAVRYKVTL